MEEPTQQAVSKKLGRVLVVDDAVEVRKTVRVTLTMAGYDVVEAEDGAQAITIMDSTDHRFRVDAILCDIRMPRLNGTEAISYFRVQYPSVPVLVLTAYPDVDLDVYLLKQGVQDVLIKPVSRDRLLPAIEKCVNHHELIKDSFAV